jgi:hypothetical protein
VRLPLGFWLATRCGSVSLRALYGALVVPAIAAIATGAAAGSLRLFALREPGMTVGNVTLVGTGGIVAAVIVVLATSETRREMRDLVYAGLRLLRRQPAHRPRRTSVFPS